MRTIITLGLAAISLATALPAIAQTTDSGGGTASSPSYDSAPAASNRAATSPNIAAGQPVKDKTGTTIGQIAKVTPDASGQQVATIKMGADSFAVDTSSLVVDKGAVVINATQAEIKGMMKK